jgi:hypothetical protein
MKKIPKQILLLVIVFVHFENLIAQDNSPDNNTPVYLHTSLFYDFPQSFGFTTGFDYLFRTKPGITKRQNEIAKTTSKSYLFSADLGFYRYPFNHTGVILKSAVGIRYSKEKFISALLFEAGLLRTFYDGKVYEVSDSLSIKEKKLFGRFYATSGITGIFGWDFEKNNHRLPVIVFLKPSTWIQFPYNSFYEFHFSLEAGVNYHLRQIHAKNHGSLKSKTFSS